MNQPDAPQILQKVKIWKSGLKYLSELCVLITNCELQKSAKTWQNCEKDKKFSVFEFFNTATSLSQFSSSRFRPIVKITSTSYPQFSITTLEKQYQRVYTKQIKWKECEYANVSSRANWPYSAYKVTSPTLMNH